MSHVNNSDLCNAGFGYGISGHQGRKGKNNDGVVPSDLEVWVSDSFCFCMRFCEELDTQIETRVHTCTHTLQETIWDFEERGDNEGKERWSRDTGRAGTLGSRLQSSSSCAVGDHVWCHLGFFTPSWLLYIFKNSITDQFPRQGITRAGQFSSYSFCAHLNKRMNVSYVSASVCCPSGTKP